MTFRNRTEAGRALAERLAPLIRPPLVVAAIPRGGVEVAMPIVERFGVPLTVVYARKLTAPVAPELAWGALDEDGEIIVDSRTVSMLGLSPADVAAAKDRVAREIQRRMVLYGAPPLATHLPASAVVLVDDGLATGLTMQAAVAYARRHRARGLIVAVPCASAPAAERFAREADHVVSLVVDPDFVAVGQYYDDFSAVPDETVCAMLDRARELAGEAGPAGGLEDSASGSALRVSFKNSAGLKLSGELILPEGPGPHPTVVFAHGWRSSKASPRNRAVAEALRSEGIATLLFDFTGHGQSEGAMDQSTRSQQVDDLACAVSLLRALDDVDTARVGVAGASSGAAAALHLAAARPGIRALALRSPNPAGAERVAERVNVPTLIVVGEHDDACLEASEALHGRFPGKHRMVIVPGGDHLFENAAARRRATAHIVGWFKQYLGSGCPAGAVTEGAKA